ncbi:FecCD family ABC transporter permease [Microbacterium indicum]|uniref:FecCD family ABC transporter permease n=1 Tax=Microbacterium indicum TaxID=358100 RepID=UPI000415F571|nr:iron chelate uptake ABC transporter family permease subunit [Microbacterium indicum]
MNRARIVLASLVVALVALAVFALAAGSYALTPAEVLGAMFDPDAGFARTVVLEWRLPRVAAALVFGAALGVSGALFQTLSRNPLGSPDVIGFSTGAYTGAILAIAFAGQTAISGAAGAIAGGLVTAFVVYALAYRGGLAGFRLIVVGIGVTAMLHAFNTWLLLRLQTEVAMTAAIWGAGSLSLVSAQTLLPVAIVVAVALAATAALHPALRQLELGDDQARAHGVPLEPARLAILVVGIALTASVTAVTGPIAFVALTAPQIAHRLTRSAGLPLVASALTGAALLLAADQIAQHVVPTGVPVGVVTIVIGGAYLLLLLARQTRRRRP